VSWTPEKRAQCNARIAKGQAQAWRDPEIRARRSTVIAQAFDDALFRAVMREKALKRLAAKTPRTVEEEQR
jgi:hypothetical protein